MTEKPKLPAAMTLAEALVKAQAEFPDIPRSRTVKVATRTGGSYTFSYAPLEVVRGAVQPILSKFGLGIVQPLVTQEGVSSVRTILIHESGERLEATVNLPPHAGSPQELGSVISYMRRYALVSMLGLATEEDNDETLPDGKAKAKAKAKPKPPEPQSVDAEKEVIALDEAVAINTLIGRLMELGVDGVKLRNTMAQEFGTPRAQELTAAQGAQLKSRLTRAVKKAEGGAS